MIRINDATDFKSPQQGRLGSTELLSLICNICVTCTVFDLPDWLYGFRPAIGSATNVKSPLSREEGMMTQVKSFRHGHPEGTHATDDKSSLNGRQGSNDATDFIKSPLQGRLGSTDFSSRQMPHTNEPIYSSDFSSRQMPHTNELIYSSDFSSR